MNLKVLMIFYDLDARAGIQRSICQLTNVFLKHGIAVDICLTRLPMPPAFGIDGYVNYITFPVSEPTGSFAMRALGKLSWALKFNSFLMSLVESSHYDVIVDHGTAWGLWHGKARFKDIPVVLFRHFSVNRFPLSRIFYFIIKLLGSRRNIVVLTDMAKRELKELGFDGKISVIPNFTLLSPDPLSTDYAKDRIISIGRASHQKGFDILIKAYIHANIYQLFKIPLFIYGASIPPFCNHILQQILPCDNPEDHGLFFLEATPHISNELRKSRFLVLSSRYEGFPFVCLEALALGVPVICTDIDGANILVKHKHNGLIVKPEDYAALGSAISLMLSDQGMSSRMSQSCANSVSSYSEEAVFSKWMHYFTEVLSL